MEMEKFPAKRWQTSRAFEKHKITYFQQLAWEAMRYGRHIHAFPPSARIAHFLFMPHLSLICEPWFQFTEIPKVHMRVQFPKLSGYIIIDL
jgi:hypothetical protein